MDNIRAAWLYPLILAAGALQAWGPPMNSALKKALINPWLTSLVSFVPIVAFLGVLALCLPRPLPTLEGVTQMPWWAPLESPSSPFSEYSHVKIKTPGAIRAGRKRHVPITASPTARPVAVAGRGRRRCGRAHVRVISTIRDRPGRTSRCGDRQGM